jgi:hypothetical protein
MYVASIHNAYGMVRLTRYLESVESPYSLVRCAEYFIYITARSKLGNRSHKPRARLARDIFPMDSLSKVFEDLETCHLVPLVQTESWCTLSYTPLSRFFLIDENTST